MASFINGEGNYEGGEEPFQLTIYLKTGEALWIVNKHNNLIDVADRLMGESEYDGGDCTVDIRGVKLMPNPVPTVLFVKPWAVAAVELTPASLERCKEMAARAKKLGLS